MQVTDLLSAFATAGGTLTLDPATTPSAALRALLTSYNGGAALVIDGATLTRADEAGQLCISGTAPCFGTPMPVELRLESDGADDVAARFTFTPPAGWTFARAFPGMPPVVDFGLPADAPPAPLLDLLLQRGALADPAIILASRGDDGGTPGVELDPGWNVTCRFVAGQAGGYLAALLAGHELPLSGRLAPVDGAAPPQPGMLPAPGLPGLLLSGALGDLTLGHLPLTGASLVLYTPVDAGWAEQHGDQPPAMGLRGDLRIGGALTIPAAIGAGVGADSLFVQVEVADATLAGLSDGAQVAGADDLHRALPADLLKLVQGLGPLRVRDVALGLERSADSSQAVSYAALGLSLHELTWPVIPGLVEVDAIDATFYVHQPLLAEQRRVGALLTANLALDGYPFQVLGQLPSAAVVAQLAAGATIPLEAVLARHLPGVPVPGQLTVTELTLSAMPAPVSVYSIRTTVAEDLKLALGHRDLTLLQTAFALDYTPKGAAGRMTGWVELAGAQLFLTASHPQPGGGWQFAGGLADKQQLGLPELLRELLAHPVELPEALQSMQIEQLTVTYDTGSGDFTLRGVASDQWRIELGPRSDALSLALEIRSSADQASGERSTSGLLAGDLNLDGTVFAVRYQFDPAEQILRGAWAGAPLHHGALGAIFSADLALPEGVSLDMSLRELSFELDLRRQGADTLVIEGRSAQYGEAYCVLQRDPSQAWGLALIIAMAAEQRQLSHLPLVGGELRPLDFLSLDTAFILLASRAFAALPLAPLSPRGAATMSVAQGLMLGALVDFAAEGEQGPQRSNLRSLIGRDLLLMEISVGSDVVLRAELETDVTFKVEHRQIRLIDPAVIVKALPLEFSLRGGIQLTLKDDLIDAAGILTIGETAATCAFDIRAEQRSLPFPLTPPGIHLTEIGVVMGMGFVPSELELGLQGNFYIGQPPAEPRPAPPAIAPGDMPADNQFVMVLGMIDIVPNPQLLAMYLKELSLDTLITVFTDHDPHLPEVLSGLRATDLLLYWADDVTQLPNGTWANPGFGLNTDLDLWGFPANAKLQISPTGITGAASIAPIRVAGVIELTGSAPDRPATFKEPPSVPGGGAWIALNTASDPYLALDWDLVLFNSITNKVHGKVTKQGLDLEIACAVADVFRSTLSVIVEGHSRLLVAFGIALRLEIGPITIAGVHLGRISLGETGMDALLEVRIEGGVALQASGDFEYDGHKLSLPTVHLAVAPQTLEHLPGLIRDEVLAAEQAIFQPIYAEAARIIGEAEALAKQLWGDLEHAEQELDQALARDLAQAEAEIQAGIDAVEQEVKALEERAAALYHSVSKELDEVEHAMSVAITEIHRLEEEAAHEAEKVGRAAVGAMADAAHAVAQVAEAAYQKVKGWVGSARDHIGSFFKKLF